MRSVIIVAGGSGSRMNSERPKQFLELLGKPVIMWTIEKFISFDPEINVIVVLPESHINEWNTLAEKYETAKKLSVTTGGASRFHSVMQGLALVKRDDIVGIHDAVRPLVSTETILRCYIEAEKNGSAIPVIDTEDSLREITVKGSNILDRSNIKRVQTPQVFQAEKLITAYETCVHRTYTDDASVYEYCYGRVNLVEGNRENIKITFPSDMIMAEAILAAKDQ